MRTGALFRSLTFYLLVAVILVWSLFPLYYAIVTSFTTGTALFVPQYYPASLDLANYADLFARTQIERSVFNSILVATATVGAALAMALLAAFAFARVSFRGRHLLLLTILATTMFPQVAILAGLYELFRFFNLYNTLWAVISSYFILLVPFTVWILTAYMRGLPREIEDVAIIDGAPPLTIVTRIFLPLIMPAMAATGLLAFIAAWNEFLFAFTFTLSEDMRTAPVAIALIWGYVYHDVPWGTIMAASVVVTLPTVLLVVVLQRKMVSGLTSGAVSG